MRLKNLDVSRLKHLKGKVWIFITTIKFFKIESVIFTSWLTYPYYRLQLTRHYF